MSKITHIWSMRMNTDKKGFSNAFYKVVSENELPNDSLEGEWRSHYYGRIYSESQFNIIRQSEHVSDQLDGTMNEDGNGLVLELSLRPTYDSLHFRILVFAIAAMLSIAIAKIAFKSDIISDYFLLTVGVMLIPMFAIIYWVAKRVIAITNLGLKASFEDVLKDIEKQIESSSI